MLTACASSRAWPAARRDRDRPRGRARPALRRRRGAAVLVADAGHRAGADPRAGSWAGSCSRSPRGRGSSSSLAVLSALIAMLAAVGPAGDAAPGAPQPRAACGDRADDGGAAPDRSFVGYALTGGLTFGALFAYISGSSFVLQEDLRPLAAGLQPRLRAERPRPRGRQPGQRAARRALRAERLLRRALGCVIASAAHAAGGRVRRRTLGVWPVMVPMFVDHLQPLVRAAQLHRARARRPRARWRGPPRRCSASSSSSSARSRRRWSGVAGPDTAVPMAVVMARSRSAR